jgi:hypothetical protein
MARLTVTRPAAKGRHNNYCGPAALSIITGMDTASAAERLRAITGRHAIRGIYTHELVSALDKEGYRVLRYRVQPEGVHTLARWLRLSRWRRRPDVYYLLVVARHFIVLKGRKLADNHNPTGVFLRQYRHRRVRVRGAWVVSRLKKADI